ncbi:MAG: hypothetical protein Q9217_003062 [Psora testacea]
MHRKAILTLSTLISAAYAQRPENISICDYYTPALFGENSAANQYKHLTYLVNTVVIGSYNNTHARAADIKVPGILAPGEFNGTKVNLLPYFNGGLKSSNRGGSSGVAVNFLDDGGAKPLMDNKPANGEDADKSHSKLLTHLYSYFGILLGCSQVGKDGFPAYSGDSSQAKVHKFMDLNTHQIGYFITQVGLAASSLGVSSTDIESVATALGEVFDVKCAPPTVIDPSQGPQLQSICLADDCPRASKGECGPYGTRAGEPSVANATLAMGQGKNTTTDTNGTIRATESKGPTTGPKPTKTGSPSEASVVVIECWLAVLVGIATISALALAL